MRLVRFNRYTERPILARLGAILGEETVVDLKAACARYLQEKGEPLAYELAGLYIPGSIIALLAAGASSLRIVQEVVAWAEMLRRSDKSADGVRGEPLFTPYGACRLHAPVRPTKLIMARFNDAHPSASVQFVSKPLGTIVGPTRNIISPYDSVRMRCAAGVAIVIGKVCRSVAEADISNVVAGAVLMTDVSLDAEQEHGEFVNSMYETFAPSGPWFSMGDDTPNLSEGRVTGYINGHMFSSFGLRDLPWSPQKTISFLSQMGFDPGDTVWLGLQPKPRDTITLGDMASCEMANLGRLDNKVDVAQPPN